MKIVAMSDLHGFMPEVPECDLLIVGGDICPDLFGGVSAKQDPERQWRWFQSVWMPYIKAQPARRILVTWGNHDFCGEHVNTPDRLYADGKVLVGVDWLQVFEDKKIWLTPWSNEFMGWAFMKEHADLEPIYAAIPEDVDILVSHQPPYGCGDLYAQPAMKNGMECWTRQHIGSCELLYHIERVRPEIVICGHLHKGYGTYEVGETKVYNVSVVNERYELVNEPTIIHVE